jgi:hypothetical protein
MFNDEFLTTIQACKLLKVSDRTLYSYRKRYFVPQVHWYREDGGRTIWYSKRMLQALVLCEFDTNDRQYQALVEKYLKEKEQFWIKPVKTAS